LDHGQHELVAEDEGHEPVGEDVGQRQRQAQRGHGRNDEAGNQEAEVEAAESVLK